MADRHFLRTSPTSSLRPPAAPSRPSRRRAPRPTLPPLPQSPSDSTPWVDVAHAQGRGETKRKGYSRPNLAMVTTVLFPEHQHHQAAMEPAPPPITEPPQPYHEHLSRLPLEPPTPSFRSMVAAARDGGPSLLEA